MVTHNDPENYGSVLRDCSAVITINPKSAKAYYRSGLALMALERLGEALDCCDRCLEFDKNNAGVVALRGKASTKKKEKETKERERLERIRKEQEEQRALKAAFAVRGQMLMG